MLYVCYCVHVLCVCAVVHVQVFVNVHAWLCVRNVDRKAEFRECENGQQRSAVGWKESQCSGPSGLFGRQVVGFGCGVWLRCVLAATLRILAVVLAVARILAVVLAVARILAAVLAVARILAVVLAAARKSQKRATEKKRESQQQRRIALRASENALEIDAGKWWVLVGRWAHFGCWLWAHFDLWLCAHTSPLRAPAVVQKIAATFLVFAVLPPSRHPSASAMGAYRTWV